MNLLTYVNQEKSRKARAFSTKAKWAGGVTIVLAATAIGYYILLPDVLSFVSNAAEKVGLDGQSQWIESASVRTRMERNAEKLYGSEVEWIVLPRSQFESFSEVVLESLPVGTTFSFLTLEEQQFGAFVPSGARDSISSRVTKLEEAKAEQGGAGQPATRSQSKLEGSNKPQPEAEGRSR
jgi:hypothetical protein